MKGFPCSLVLDSATWGRWRLPSILSRILRSPTRHGVTPGGPMTPCSASFVLKSTGASASLCCPDQTGSLSDQGGSDRRSFPRRMTSASGGFTVPRLRQAQPLGYLLSPHCAFQGHAAHIRERPPMLGPNDVSVPWESGEHYRLVSHSCIPTPSFHGAHKGTKSFTAFYGECPEGHSVRRKRQIAFFCTNSEEKTLIFSSRDILQKTARFFSRSD
jgi:hypothetical protein